MMKVTEISGISLISGKKGKEWKKLLRESPQIQVLYLQQFGNPKEKDGLSGQAIEASRQERGVAMDYDDSFYDRYSSSDVVQALIFDGQRETVAVRLYISKISPEVGQAIANLPAYKKFLITHRFVGLWGAAHVGIQIGNKLIHFFDNHFVKIDTVKARNALYVMKISQSGSLTLTPKVKKCIADFVVEWNTEKFYNQATRNCQHFVEDICHSLNKILKEDEKFKLPIAGTNPQVKGLLDTVLKRPQHAGFKFYWQATKQEVEFISHADLDDFEEENKHKLTDEDREYLKGFHRAFQMRENDDRNGEEIECILGGLTRFPKTSLEDLQKDNYLRDKEEKGRNYLSPAGIQSYIFSPAKENSLYNLNLDLSWEDQQPTRYKTQTVQLVPIRLVVLCGDPHLKADHPQILRYPHVGIQVGNKILRFLNNHFVEVVPFDEARILYINTVSSGGGNVPHSPELEVAVASVVLEWNTRQYYTESSNGFKFFQSVCKRINSQCKPQKELDAELLEGNRNFILNFIERVSREPELVKTLDFLEEEVPLKTAGELRDWMREHRDDLMSPEHVSFKFHLQGFANALLICKFENVHYHI